jgi:hypothetical protein
MDVRPFSKKTSRLHPAWRSSEAQTLKSYEFGGGN